MVGPAADRIQIPRDRIIQIGRYGDPVLRAGAKQRVNEGVQHRRRALYSPPKTKTFPLLSNTEMKYKRGGYSWD
jgi:hypothetical protein